MDHPPGSTLEAITRLNDAVRNLAQVTVEEARTNWRPWALAVGLTYTAVVLVTILGG